MTNTTNEEKDLTIKDETPSIINDEQYEEKNTIRQSLGSKLIFTDFESIFNADTKSLDPIPAIEILKTAGYEIHVFPGLYFEIETDIKIQLMRLGIVGDNIHFIPQQSKLETILEIAQGREFALFGNNILDLQISQFAALYVTTTEASHILTQISNDIYPKSNFWDNILLKFISQWDDKVIKEIDKGILKYCAIHYLTPLKLKQLVEHGIVSKDDTIRILNEALSNNKAQSDDIEYHLIDTGLIAIEETIAKEKSTITHKIVSVRDVLRNGVYTDGQPKVLLLETRNPYLVLNILDILKDGGDVTSIFFVNHTGMSRLHNAFNNEFGTKLPTF